MKSRIIILSLALLMISTTIGWAQSSATKAKKVKVEKLITQPKKYGEMEQIRVKGEVTSSYSVSTYQLYTVKDKSDQEITVWGSGKVSPAIGEKVDITGQLKENYRIGDKTMLVFIEKKK